MDIKPGSGKAKQNNCCKSISLPFFNSRIKFECFTVFTHLQDKLLSEGPGIWIILFVLVVFDGRDKLLVKTPSVFDVICSSTAGYVAKQ